MSSLPRVLLVDDDPRVLSALERSLRKEPYETETVGNGQAALDLLAEDPDFGLVISDQKMPGMTGIELLSRLRSERPHIGRILLSGYSAGIEAIDLARAALDAQHPKPWEDADLKESIRAALGISG